MYYMGFMLKLNLSKYFFSYMFHYYYYFFFLLEITLTLVFSCCFYYFHGVYFIIFAVISSLFSRCFTSLSFAVLSSLFSRCFLHCFRGVFLYQILFFTIFLVVSSLQYFLYQYFHSVPYYLLNCNFANYIFLWFFYITINKDFDTLKLFVSRKL
jgi:hypothetical protein